MKPRNGRTYNAKQGGAMLGVAERTFKRWDAAGHVVDLPNRSGPDVAATMARVNNERDPTHGGRPDRGFGGASTDVPRRTQREAFEPGMVSDAARLLKARALSEAARAKWMQLRIAERTGELIPRAEAEQAWLDSVTAARVALEGLPVRLCHRLVGLDATAIRGLLVAEVMGALQGLSEVRADGDGMDGSGAGADPP